MNMPKKIKQHILKFLGVTGGYLTVMEGVERGHLLMSLVTKSDPYDKFGCVATAIYLVIFAWFCWRLYAGIYRDGDFLD